jgi:diguanylate cyclase (GGDEF)-like protein
MGERQAARIVDVSEVQLRMAMVQAGIWLTYIVCATISLYALVTWEQPHRSLILALLSVAICGALLIPRLPLERVVRGPLAEPFFLLWSFLDVALVAVIVAADGGGASPFAAVFFIPLVFAALFYPLRSFVAVAAVIVFVYVGAATIGDTTPDTTYIAFISVALATVAVMCAWLAQNHDRNRALLNTVSRTDPLTNCLNRRGFEERVEAELSAGVRSGRPLTLMLIDLDCFKAVNDRLGHAAGDELLCWVADGIERSVRSMDTTARLGGDEFAVLIPETAKSEAGAVVDRIGVALANRIEVTVGLASFPEDGTDLEELYRAADRDLYQHKREGHHAAGNRELSWAATLARAVNARMGAAPEQSEIAGHAAGLARNLGWSGADLASFTLAAMVHDVGKVPVPDRILRKRGPLDENEYDELRRHLVHGAEMIGRIEGLEPIAPWLRYAHENFDGSGYPEGLRGDEIPLASRMLRVVAAFDAMTSERAYRSAMSPEQARELLRRNSGTHFDPACVGAFEAYLVNEAPVPAI